MLFYGFEPVATLLENVRERLYGVSPEHGYARLLEIGYALEYGTCREMPAGVCTTMMLAENRTLHLFLFCSSLVGATRNCPS